MSDADADELVWYAWITKGKDEKWCLLSSTRGLSDEMPLITRHRDRADRLRFYAEGYGQGFGRPVRLIRLEAVGPDLESFDP